VPGHLGSWGRAVAAGAEVVDLGDRVLGTPSGPEAVGGRLEVGLEYRLQHEFQRGLDHLVGHSGTNSASRRNTKLSCIRQQPDASRRQRSAKLRE
jgi:hypothetical protein